MNGPLKIGDIVKAAEPDYCYGVGELHMHVTKIGGSFPLIVDTLIIGS